MIGRQLSRWTLAWFASGLAGLVLALGLAAAGAGGPGGWTTGAGLAVLHLFALGWLSQVMLGALIQFMPVLCARPLCWPGLSLPALVLTGVGTVMLAAGLAALDGWTTGQGLLALAPLVLLGAFGLAGAMLVPTLLAAGAVRGAEGRMVALALAALAGLWATGAAMAGALSGYGWPPVVVADALPLHALLGIGGWLTLAAFGVSYKLFAMFLLAPEGDNPLRRAVFATAALGLAAALAFAALALSGAGPVAPAPVALAGIAAIALHLAEIRRLWRSRRRPQVEATMQWSRAALAFLALSAALLVPAGLRGGPWAEAAGFAALAGWLSTLTLAQMVRIVSFLTWIQIFAPQIGRRPVPLVADLSDARAAGRWLALWVAGTAAGTLALGLGHGPGFRLAALAMLAAALGLGAEAVAIRRLRHLDPARRPPTLPPLVRPVSLQGAPHDHTRTPRA